MCKNNNYYLAISLNPSESNAVMGNIENGFLRLTDIYTFHIRLLYLNGIYYWDIYDIIDQIKKTIQISIEKTGKKPQYMSIDCWAHDFALLDEHNNLIELPMSYQNFTDKAYMDEVCEILGKKEIYNITGNNFNPFNTLYQLYYLKKERPALLAKAKKIAFLPDIINYMLTGKLECEPTYAVTTQAFNICTKNWEHAFFDKLGLDVNLMPHVIENGHIIGDVKKEILLGTGIDEMKVILGATSDSSASVNGFAEEGQNWAVIFSKSWTIMGIQVNNPILTNQALKMNFTNSICQENKYFFQSAVYGLELLERCRGFWGDNDISQQEIFNPKAPSFKYLIDLHDPIFLMPNDPIGHIHEFFKKKSLPAPKTKEDIIQCIYESIAFMCRFLLDEIKHFAPEFIERIYIGNGGAHDKYLCSCIANATGISLYAGNENSSTTGNILLQMMTIGEIDNIKKAHELIGTAINYEVFEPYCHAEWDNAYFMKFLNII